MFSVPVVDQPFTDLIEGTQRSFITCAETVILDETPNLSEAAKDRLLRRFQLATLGIGLTGVMIELAALIPTKELPGVTITPKDAAKIASNSFGFIETTIGAGNKVGLSIARWYAWPDVEEEEDRYRGTIIDGKIAYPQRLENLTLGLDPTNREAQLVPIGIEQAISGWETQVGSIP
jgi:hypothetical protein